MKTKLITKVPGLFCLTFLAIGPISGRAQGTPPPQGGAGCPVCEMKPGMPHGEKAMEMLGQRLNLSEEQKAKIKPIVEASMPQVKAIHEEARNKLKGVMEAAHEKMKPILTPEQQQKLQELKKQVETGSYPGGPGAMHGMHGMHGKPGMDAGQPGEHLMKALNLTPDQQKQVQPILESTRREMKALWQDASLTPEQKKAKAKELREASHAKIKGLLTPEQQQQLEKIKNEHGLGGPH